MKRQELKVLERAKALRKPGVVGYVVEEAGDRLLIGVSNAFGCYLVELPVSACSGLDARLKLAELLGFPSQSPEEIRATAKRG